MFFYKMEELRFKRKKVAFDIVRMMGGSRGS